MAMIRMHVRFVGLLTLMLQDFDNFITTHSIVSDSYIDRGLVLKVGCDDLTY